MNKNSVISQNLSLKNFLYNSLKEWSWLIYTIFDHLNGWWMIQDTRSRTIEVYFKLTISKGGIYLWIIFKSLKVWEEAVHTTAKKELEGISTNLFMEESNQSCGEKYWLWRKNNIVLDVGSRKKNWRILKVDS